MTRRQESLLKRNLLKFARNRLCLSGIGKIEHRGVLKNTTCTDKRTVFNKYEEVFKSKATEDYNSPDESLKIFHKGSISSNGISVKINRANAKKRRSDYNAYLNSPEWKALRELVLIRSGYKCCDCGVVKMKGMHIHHKTYENFGNEKLEDVEPLCKPCHELRHSRTMDW